MASAMVCSPKWKIVDGELPEELTLAELSLLRVDLNGDGQVDAIDVALMLGAWGQPCTQSPCADLNGDGIVSAADLAVQLGAWPPSPNPPNVPSWATLIEAAPDPAAFSAGQGFACSPASVASPRRSRKG